jgi:hypothetical protein
MVAPCLNEAHKELFDFLNLEENPKMHWIDSVGWTIIQKMHNIVLEATIFAITSAQYISSTCDEMSTLNNQN